MLAEEMSRDARPAARRSSGPARGGAGPATSARSRLVDGFLDVLGGAPRRAAGRRPQHRGGRPALPPDPHPAAGQRSPTPWPTCSTRSRTRAATRPTSTPGPPPASLVAMLAHVAQHRYGFEFWGIRTADVRDDDGPPALLGRSPARSHPPSDVTGGRIVTRPRYGDRSDEHRHRASTATSPTTSSSTSATSAATRPPTVAPSRWRTLFRGDGVHRLGRRGLRRARRPHRARPPHRGARSTSGAGSTVDGIDWHHLPGAPHDLGAGVVHRRASPPSASSPTATS